MKLTLFRHTLNTDDDRNIIGDLFIDGGYFCKTLEDEIRPDGVKVYGKTAIQADTYEVIVNTSNRFKRKMPLLLNVPMFEGIRMHGGNDSSDTLGCVLVAFNSDGKRIWGTAERDLVQRLQQADNKIEIEIKNSFMSYSPDLQRELTKDELNGTV